MDALTRAFVPMSAAEQRLVVSAYRLLGEGLPVDPQDLADPTGWRREEVDAWLTSWPAVYLDAEGRVVGLGGIAVEAVSPHVLRIDGCEPTWMWCALDPLFIVPLLSVDSAVTSTCPTTGAAITLRLGSNGGVESEPASVVMSLLVPDGPLGADVRETFCHFVHFFASPAAAEAWVAEHPGTFWLPLAEAAHLGHRLALQAFPALSRPSRARG